VRDELGNTTPVDETASPPLLTFGAGATITGVASAPAVGSTVWVEVVDGEGDVFVSKAAFRPSPTEVHPDNSIPRQRTSAIGVLRNLPSMCPIMLMPDRIARQTTGN